jgi:hypothetical protein
MHSELRPLAGGFSRMNPSKDYRKFAEECDRLARDAQTEHQRRILLEMAAAWEELADADDREGVALSWRDRR